MDHAPLHNQISTAPNDGRAHWTKTTDQVQIRIATWEPKSESKGTVLFFPGRGDYIELYGSAIAGFVEAGFAALVIDWRGHGLSDRVAKNPKVGHVESFDDYQKDVNAMTEAAQELGLPKPWYLVGHSMGACIGLRSLMDGLDVNAAAFSAPMFDIQMASYERLAVWPLTWTLRAIGKGQLYAPGFNDLSYVFRNTFDGNTLTNSRENYEHWKMQGTEVPALHTGGPSMGWLYAALSETRALAQRPSPDVPCIAFCGDQEETVVVSAIQNRFESWPSGHFERVSNAKHELFLETPDVTAAVVGKIIKYFQNHAQ